MGNTYKNIDISIIIPLYKGGKYCTRLLERIEKNCLYIHMFQNCSIEVVFVNDYPDEKIIIGEEKRPFAVKIIEQKQNMGIQASRINGITSSRGEYIIMLDQDDLVTDNWLYSQWTRIVSGKSNYCVCNGWEGRFRVLWAREDTQKKINDLTYYFEKGNAIISPGQVIIRKKCLPEEWMQNIQVCNGADDFLLWVIVLKKGNKFLLNTEPLYYHSPERSSDSINLSGMMDSLRETVQILSRLKLLKPNELQMLNRQIEEKEFSSIGKALELSNIDAQRIYGDFIKFNKMFHIMFDWIKLRNRGIGIDRYLKKYNYLSIAIYGMGYIGECLYEELQDSDISVQYGIDCTAIDFFGELPIVRIETDLRKVDAVIMTIAKEDKKLIKMVREKIECPIIMISEILAELEIIETKR